jgi:TolB-like protein
MFLGSCVEDFIERLKQRKLVQWALAYAAVAFALIQVLDIVAQRFGWPESVERFTIVVMAVGLLVTLVLAWYHGERGAQTTTSTELLVIALLLSTGGVVAWRLAPAPITRATAAVSSPAVGAAGTTAVPDKSIAVLPFLDLSKNHDQGYFSDGMSEELLDALGQIKGLKVAGRTSSFHFRDSKEDLATVGKALGVANVLEGSVRKQGDEVRIAVRLVEVADSKDLWSHDYDGDLSDVFRLQENIAKAVTEQLRIVLVGGQKVQLVPMLTANPEAHALYLRASQIFARRDGTHFPEAISQLQQAITLDPRFARAHALLGAVLAVSSNYMPVDFDATSRQAEMEAKAALSLDPRLAEAHAVLGLVREDLRDYVGARLELERAIAIDPNDTTALGWMGSLWLETGYTAKASQTYDRILAIDPLLPSALAWRARICFDSGDNATARRMFEQSTALGLSWSEARFADLEFAEGQKDEAIASATRGLTAYLAEFPEGTSAILSHGLYGDAAARSKALTAIDAYLATKPKTLAGAAPWAELRLGEPARALALVAPAPTGNDQLFLRDLWSPFGKQARSLPQFGAFLGSTGIATFWGRYGPAPGCRRSGDGSYACT